MDLYPFSPEQLKILEIFHSVALRRNVAARLSDQTFVHYSSADALLSMIEKNEVWMRKAATMNDFREVDYGRECLVSAYNGVDGNRLKAMLDSMFPGFSAKMEPHFNGWYPHFWSDTFLTCLSEGPSEFPFEISQAIVKKLRDKGVSEPEKRVTVSNIPLRNWG